jgi:hypothetical protein
MRNLIIDGAAGGETKKCHDVTFPLFTLHRGNDRVHFSTGLINDRVHFSTGLINGPEYFFVYHLKPNG